MNLVTRIPVQSARASVIIPAANLSALLNYDPSALGFWNLYDGSVFSKGAALSLSAQDAVNKPPVFSSQGLLVDSVYQDSYLPVKANGNRLFDADMPNGVTIVVAMKYVPVDLTSGKNVIIAGNINGAQGGMGLVTFENRPGYSVANVNAKFGTMTSITLLNDWMFCALSYDKVNRKLSVLWKQPASGTDVTATYTDTDASPYVPSATLPYALGNASFSAESLTAKNTVAEFALYDRSMTMAELVSKYSESQVRLLAQGIVI